MSCYCPLPSPLTSAERKPGWVANTNWSLFEQGESPEPIRVMGFAFIVFTFMLSLISGK